MLATPGAAQGSTMGVWGSAPDGTVVVTPGAASGADYGAALRAVAESNGCARAVGVPSHACPDCSSRMGTHCLSSVP